jgi:hypothetical protein
MCAVASRGLYHGMGPDELSAEGIGFSLFEMQTLAGLVSRVIAEERERRDAALTPSIVRSTPIAEAPADPSAGRPEADVAAADGDRNRAAHHAEEDTRPQPRLRLIGSPAGA